MNHFVLYSLITLIIIAGSHSHAKNPVAYSKDRFPAETAQLRVLFKELMAFKDHPTFHEVGFAECCPYHNWLGRMEDFRASLPDGPKGVEFIAEWGIGPTELLLLGMNYMSTHGFETPDMKESRERIATGLAPRIKPTKEQGVVVDHTHTACTDLQVWKDFRAVPLDDPKLAYEILYDSPHCFKVNVGTVVSAPIAKYRDPSRDVKIGGKTFKDPGFYYVLLRDGRKVWMAADALLYEEE